jgi:hypothetical protein
MVESGLLDLFILLGPTPTEVVRQYVSLTGTAHLPQVNNSLDDTSINFLLVVGIRVPPITLEL